MTADYYSMGEVLPDLDPNRLEHEGSRRLLAACLQHPAFDVVELRRVERQDGDGASVVDGIVVECCDRTVPSRNAVGIKNRERLLLLHGPGLLTSHEVRALRANFPPTAHQNAVPDSEPPSLCLYFEPWSAVERTWTPAKQLQRVLWWLRETALGTLHQSDQPLERLHFVSPYQVVLPSDFNQRAATHAEILQLTGPGSRGNGRVLRGVFQPKGATQAHDGLEPLVVAVPKMVSNRIEQYPATLGALDDQLARHGSTLLASLVEAAKKALPNTGGLPINGQHVKHTLLLLQVPVARAVDAAPQRTDIEGFLVHDTSLAQLGIACGAYFDGKDGKAYERHDLQFAAAGKTENVDTWRDLTVEPIEVRLALTPQDARRFSGVSDGGADVDGVLAGVGALGSCMAELWSREGWGRWTYVDDDILQAHNLVRHIAKDGHIGWAKVDVVANMVALSWPTAPKPKAVIAKVNDLDNAEVKAAVSAASLLIDATTTLEVPRDLSDRDDCPRMASVFLTPSGRGSVLLLEDAERAVRLSSMEAQYYRAILNRDWGAKHLAGHLGSYWVGAGCRDLSGVLPQEVVQLHGATLARQLRLLSARADAQLRVWTMDAETGALAVDVLPVESSIESPLGEWCAILDEGLAKKLRELRSASLPNETGGLVLGYVDQKRKAIHVVDVLPAPCDSKSSRTSFVRGVDGSKEALERSAELTANIVGYLGEWHSHPRHLSAMPSSDDAGLLAYLANTLAMDGVPALMVIVGESDISISLQEGRTE